MALCENISTKNKADLDLSQGAPGELLGGRPLEFLLR